jgi:beta-galactosidase/beta-glucuronidase
VIDVVAKDDTESDVFPRGKQSLDPHWIFYRPTSGIWGDVYLEKVPVTGYISSLGIDANYDSKTLKVVAPFVGGKIKKATCEVFYKDKEVASFPLDSNGEGEVSLAKDFYSWSPSEPNLYDLVLKINDDEVHSYCGFRKFSSVVINGFRLFTLNDKPLFLSGLLDQGYYNQNTALTPLNEESITSDLAYVKACGFNCLRKHIKIEPMRYYYHCDKLGIILIQDLVSGGDKFDIVKLTYLPHFGINLTGPDTHVENINRHNPVSRILFEKDLVTTYHYLNNVVSIAIWTIFNESWGQYSARRVSKIMQDLDHTRLVDATSGWTDKGAGDFKSLHIYYQKIKAKNDHKRILSLSEWGGTSLPLDNHIYAPEPYGKHPCPSKRALLNSIDKSVTKEIIPLIKKQGLSVSIYTQLSDVEAETNGLLTYDRLIQKIPSQYLLPINEKMYAAFSSIFH